LTGPSAFKSSSHADSLRDTCEKLGQDYKTIRDQTDMTGLMEGLYLKWEEDGQVKGRYKFVRQDFVNKIIDSNEEDGHLINRPIIPNRIREDVDLFVE